MLPENHLFSEIKNLIVSAKHSVGRAVNAELVLLYWQIGNSIRYEILQDQRAEFGKQVVRKLAEQLTAEFGKGYNHINLWLFIRFATVFNDVEIVYAVRKLFSWTHFRQFLALEDDLKRRFYMEMCRIEGWSTRQLEERIDSMLYERTALSRKPDELIAQELKHIETSGAVSEDFVFRDPYILDFLDLKDTYSEKDLETAILADLQGFILEFGADFAFMARQKRIVIDGEDYKMDLLFYHRRLRRLVVIDLKMRNFKPKDKAQMELYLRWLEKNEHIEGENEPMGLILCAGKSEEHIELLMLDHGNIRVSQYLTELPPKAVLQAKLHAAIERARRGKTPNPTFALRRHYRKV